jgi:hypothetical protein
MTTVAEGVEEPAQVQVLGGEGCDQMQGFLAARPMPAEDIRTFLRNWRDPRPTASARAAGEAAPADPGAADPVETLNMGEMVSAAADNFAPWTSPQRPAPALPSTST